jgi:hypothetical protein
MAAGPAIAGKAPNKCPDGKGGVNITDFPCRPIDAVPPPPPALPPCPLTREARSKAEHLEEQFLRRFSDEEKHRAVFSADLQEIVAHLRLSQGRLADLHRELKAIVDELGFYERRPVPPDLQRRVDANEAQFTALADVFRGLETDARTLLARYECDRGQFAIRWQGGAPGSSACMAPC